MEKKDLDQLFALLDTLPNPVTFNELAYDDEGQAYDKIIYVNRRFSELIGYSPEEIPDDRAWFEKAYPDKKYQQYIASEWFKAVEKAKAENSDLTGFPARVHCKDEEERWFSITTQLEHTISQKYRTIVFMKIEAPEQSKLDLDQKTMELIEERVLLKTIIDSAPVRIFWKDTEGVYLGCNKAFLRDAHLDDESEIIGKTDFEMVWKEDAQRYREDDRQVRESGIAKLNYVEAQPQGDEKELVLSTSKVPLKDAAGETIGVLGLYEDITREYEAKKTLKEHEKLMLLQSRQAAMGEMISMIAHQWRQPLSAISAGATYLQMRYALEQLSVDEVNEYAQKILEKTQFLSQTIIDFRDFFKSQKIKEEIVVHDALQQALNIISTPLEQNNIELRTSYLSTQRFYTYDKELQHAFINIIKNAADAHIERAIEGKYIEVQTRDIENGVSVEISDNAGGIDESIINRIFDPYFSTKEEKNGTGLGLYMCKTIIQKRLKGKISCKRKGEGTSFLIELPLGQAFDD